MLKLFILSTSTKNLKIHTFTIGAKINGMKNTGFNTSGAPNKIGSFTPRMLVQLMLYQWLLFRFDLVNHININGTTNVAPVPP